MGWCAALGTGFRGRTSSGDRLEIYPTNAEVRARNVVRTSRSARVDTGHRGESALRSGNPWLGESSPSGNVRDGRCTQRESRAGMGRFHQPADAGPFAWLVVDPDDGCCWGMSSGDRLEICPTGNRRGFPDREVLVCRLSGDRIESRGEQSSARFEVQGRGPTSWPQGDQITVRRCNRWVRFVKSNVVVPSEIGLRAQVRSRAQSCDGTHQGLSMGHGTPLDLSEVSQRRSINRGG